MCSGSNCSSSTTDQPRRTNDHALRRAHDPATDHHCVDPLHPVRLGAVEPLRPKPVTRRRELALFAVPMVLLAIGANIGNASRPPC